VDIDDEMIHQLMEEGVPSTPILKIACRSSLFFEKCKLPSRKSLHGVEVPDLGEGNPNPDIGWRVIP
jgi:hypothetical protein